MADRVPVVTRIPVRLSPPPAPDYEVQVGAGTLSSLAALLPRLCPAHRYAIITDDRVRGLYGERLVEVLTDAGLRIELFSFPEGEARKTREMWAALSDRMFATGIGRDAAIIALGGGVVGDLAGFVAATYMRGLPWVQVPTTLLAMIDASVGGKTGVDTPAGKNLIGAFHQPRLVLADPELLRTLAPEQLRAGMAEAVKHAAVADAEHFQWLLEHAAALLAGDAEMLAELVIHSVRIKAGVVMRDEKESGPRKILNFGHTIGHALELASGYKLLHGEAVAIGMVVEAEVGERMGITERGTAQRLREALTALKLPTEVLLGTDPEALLAATRLDKKARGGRPEYVLLERIGAVYRGEGKWAHGVEEEVVRECVALRANAQYAVRSTQ